MVGSLRRVPPGRILALDGPGAVPSCQSLWWPRVTLMPSGSSGGKKRIRGRSVGKSSSSQNSSGSWWTCQWADLRLRSVTGHTEERWGRVLPPPRTHAHPTPCFGAATPSGDTTPQATEAGDITTATSLGCCAEAGGGLVGLCCGMATMTTHHGHQGHPPWPLSMVCSAPHCCPWSCHGGTHHGGTHHGGTHHPAAQGLGRDRCHGQVTRGPLVHMGPPEHSGHGWLSVTLEPHGHHGDGGDDSAARNRPCGLHSTCPSVPVLLPSARPSFHLSVPFLPSIHPSSSFCLSIIPSIPWSLPSFLPSILPSVLTSVRSSFPPSFHPFLFPPILLYISFLCPSFPPFPSILPSIPFLLLWHSVPPSILPFMPFLLLSILLSVLSCFHPSLPWSLCFLPSLSYFLLFRLSYQSLLSFVPFPLPSFPSVHPSLHPSPPPICSSVCPSILTSVSPFLPATHPSVLPFPPSFCPSLPPIIPSLPLCILLSVLPSIHPPFP